MTYILEVWCHDRCWHKEGPCPSRSITHRSKFVTFLLKMVLSLYKPVLFVSRCYSRVKALFFLHETSIGKLKQSKRCIKIYKLLIYSVEYFLRKDLFTCISVTIKAWPLSPIRNKPGRNSHGVSEKQISNISITWQFCDCRMNERETEIEWENYQYQCNSTRLGRMDKHIYNEIQWKS